MPSNITPETATLISILPYTQTLDVTTAPTGTGYVSTCDSTQYHAVWYAYVAASTDTYIALNADASGAGNYVPRVSIWTGTLGSLTQYSVSDGFETQSYCDALGADNWFMVPVVAGMAYYIQVTDTNNSSPLGADLVFQMVAQAQDTAAAGSIVIRDDVSGFPAAVIDPTTGDFLRWIDIPAGETSATLPDGTTCHQNGSTALGIRSIAVYDADIALVAAIDFGVGHTVRGISSDQNATFYVMHDASGTAYCTQVSNLGVQGTTRTLPHLGDVGTITRDGSTLYYAVSGTNNTPIWAFDFAGNAPLSDLNGGVASEQLVGVGTGYVSSDDLIWFAFGSSAAGANPKLRGFNAAGTILHTYSLVSGSMVKLNRWCGGLDGDDVVWTWGHPSSADGFAYFVEFDLSTGSVLLSTPAVLEDTISGQNGNPYAMSNSCPIYILPEGLTPPAPPTPTFHTRTLVRRRVRRGPILFSEQKGLQVRQSVSLFAVDMQPGVGNSDTPEPLVMVRASKDAGRTWGNERRMSVGRVGEYTKRLNAWQWGTGRQWVFEVSTSDPVTWNLVQALIKIDAGSS